MLSVSHLYMLQGCGPDHSPNRAAYPESRKVPFNGIPGPWNKDFTDCLTRIPHAAAAFMSRCRSLFLRKCVENYSRLLK